MGSSNHTRDRQHRARRWQELQRDPRPHGLAELARAYLAAGDHDLADEVLVFGERAFPGNDDLARVRAVLLTSLAADEIRVRKDRLAADPSVTAHLELADTYRRVGRLDQSVATLRALLDAHGEVSTALNWLGELRYLRYQETLASVDGVAASDFLRRAMESDADAVKPRMLLAQLQFQVGAPRRAAATLRALLRACPEHDRARELLVAADAAPGSDAPGMDEDLESCFAEVEEHMELAAALPWEAVAQRAAGAVNPMVVARELERLRHEIEGSRVAAMGTLADAAQDATPGSEALTDEARGLAGFTELAARRMDLGPPSGLLIEGDAGGLVVEMKRGQALAVVLPDGARRTVEEASVATRDALERMVRGR